MRRIATTFALVLAAAAAFAVSAGADDKKTYQAELFNAFGLVEGSEARIAGVKAGTVTGLDITPEKTALITFEIEPEFPELTNQASCSSEPQSLIAEYFIDCQPGAGDGPLEGPIPADRNQTTVQNDLVQNSLREPFKRRFQLILNEFGTALVGNSENLNAAIRSGAPALRELKKVLNILGRQNRTIAQLNTDSDTVFARLTENREDVVRFIDEAEDAGRISAERREDLSTDFDLLDDFLVELKPVMTELGNLAREQTPLLVDLRASAPGLNKLAKNLPAFNRASQVSLESLGSASEVGNRAVTKSRDEISELNVTAQKAFSPVNQVATFLESIDDPRRAVEEDCDARYDLRHQAGEADRRTGILEQRLGVNLTGRHDIAPVPATDPIGCNLDPGSPTGNPGYTGLEGLLNYAYVQPASLNLFDAAGHALQIHVVGASSESEGDNGECGEYSQGPEWPRTAFHGGGLTNNPRDAAHCVSILGDFQPGISAGTVLPSGLTDLNPNGPGGELRRYDGSVCPDESTWYSICRNNAFNPYSSLQINDAPATAPAPGVTEAPSDEELEDILEDIRKGVEEDLDEIRDQLGLPPGAPLPPEVIDALGGGAGGNGEGESGDPSAGAPSTGAAPSTSSSNPSSAAATDLMDYLFGP